ncbi:MAG: amino acid ABC transporter permease [Rhodobacteraceae bacterium]|nr:amino acid ABC transporter permease [Paracoccaceae bacterium]
MVLGIEPRRAARVRPLDWARRNLFRTWFDGILTLSMGAALAALLPRLVDWAYTNAAFRPDPEACRAASGACWSVIVDMWPLFFVGLYPGSERWRLAVAVGILLLAAAAVVTGLVRRPRRRLAVAGLAASAFLVLLHGGIAGLPAVPPRQWGGLLLTIVLAVFSQTLAFPAGVLLALGRRSTRHPIVHTLCTIYIEVVRSVPLVMILLMATLILPLFLPPWLRPDTTLMAAVGITLFSAASIAEVVRGGLAGVPRGQEEAASSLGLTRVQTLRFIVLPQALRRVQPALIGTFINFIKGSTLVVAIGLYDVLGGAVLAAANPRWVGHSIEPLMFVAFLFWLICFSFSQYSRRLEGRYANRPAVAGASQETDMQGARQVG